ncbi:MAG: hypothetical protein JXB62_01265 [Pirellulales bacterium]|nr:hypothetical protein [Pirellulales bacterium]
MNKVPWMLCLVTLAAVVVWGCGPSAEDPAASDASPAVGAPGAHAALVNVVLCGECGQLEGGAVCCAQDAATCGKCELAKGAPGCCAIAKGTDVTLCAQCGQVKGTEACCAEDAVKCEKCGLAKEAPGCCNIEA